MTENYKRLQIVIIFDEKKVNIAKIQKYSWSYVPDPSIWLCSMHAHILNVFCLSDDCIITNKQNFDCSIAVLHVKIGEKINEPC